MNFDLNLVPFIDVLSTSICFLLMTAVFMQLGTVNVRQAIGDSPKAANEKNPPSLWLRLTDSGAIEMSVKNSKGRGVRDMTVNAGIGSTNSWEKVSQSLSTLKRIHPDLDVALILPTANSQYQDLIRLMDEVKHGQINQVGIAPL